MRHRAPRFLHVLLCAPVALLTMAAATPSTHVRAASPQPPKPFIVAIDAGHGGSPDDGNPSQAYDSGAVGANGLLEKDITLDMAFRLERMLEAQDVEVVLTRDRDTSIGISPRMQTAVDAGAQLFVSIHMNGYSDPSVNGSLVLYPNEQSRSFGQTMADAVARGLAPYGVLPRGLQYRPELWQHATMPTATLEPLFITNPDGAALMARSDVRDALSRAIVVGLDSAVPQMEAQRARIEAWRATHPGWTPSTMVPHPHVSPRSAAPQGAVGPGPLLGAQPALLLLLLAGPPLLVLLRRPLFHAASAMSRALVAAVGGGAHEWAAPHSGEWRAGPHHRERAERRRRLLERSRTQSWARTTGAALPNGGAANLRAARGARPVSLGSRHQARLRAGR